MIVVETEDGSVEFDASRFSTDEHNNLLIWVGAQGDKLLRVFAHGFWTAVGVDEGQVE